MKLKYYKSRLLKLVCRTPKIAVKSLKLLGVLIDKVTEKLSRLFYE